LKIADASVVQRYPSLLPDDRTVLFTQISPDPERTGVFAAAAGDMEARRILREPVNAKYAAGWLFFGQREKLAMQRFDPSQLRLEGEPRIVVNDAWPFEGRTNFDVSESVLAYSRAATIESRLTWFDRSGRPLKTVGPAGPFIHMELSKDERRVALERHDGVRGELWTLDLAREVLTRFTSGPGWSLHPHWSPDGSAIVYSATDEQSMALFRRDSDGSGREEKLLGLGQVGPKQPTDWALDYIVYSDLGVVSSDLWLLPLSGKRELVRYAAASTRNSQGRVSPDGKWMAYVFPGIRRPRSLRRAFSDSIGEVAHLPRGRLPTTMACR